MLMKLEDEQYYKQQNEVYDDLKNDIYTSNKPTINEKLIFQKRQQRNLKNLKSFCQISNLVIEDQIKSLVVFSLKNLKKNSKNGSNFYALFVLSY